MVDDNNVVSEENADILETSDVVFGASRGFRWLLLIAGVVGFVASFDLVVEKFALLKDPTYELSCNINPLLSCGSVVITPQAEAFGFPNPLLGVAGFAVVITVAMALFAGGQFRRWFWVGLCVGSGLGLAFVVWLIFQSLYRIGALCPYCMVVWVVTVPIFLFSVRETLGQSTAGQDTVKGLLIAAYRRWTWLWVVLFYAVVVALIAIRFADFWATLV
jgi:uncharacterized membrane protein